MSGPERAQAQRARPGPHERPLNLIHRNNSPEPVSMRVSGRFAPRLLRPVRAALYWPLQALPYLPGGPLKYLWLVRFVVGLDSPLRRISLGRALHARTD